MTRLRRFLERPIADRDRRRAFAVTAATLLIAAVGLSLTADPADRQTGTSRARLPLARPDLAPPRPAGDLPPLVLEVARRFLHAYLAHLYGSGPGREIHGASDRLRRELAVQPIRVSPAMRGQRPRIARLEADRLDGRWLVNAEIATGTVSFPIAVVVADGPGGPVVTRLVED